MLNFKGITSTFRTLKWNLVAGIHTLSAITSAGLNANNTDSDDFEEAFSRLPEDEQDMVGFYADARLLQIENQKSGKKITIENAINQILINHKVETQYSPEQILGIARQHWDQVTLPYIERLEEELLEDLLPT